MSHAAQRRSFDSDGRKILHSGIDYPIECFQLFARLARAGSFTRWFIYGLNSKLHHSWIRSVRGERRLEYKRAIMRDSISTCLTTIAVFVNNDAWRIDKNVYV